MADAPGSPRTRAIRPVDLQHTIGNRTTAKFANQVSDARDASIVINGASRPPARSLLQRYTDLASHYQDKNFEGKADWIARFRTAQETLNNIAIVDQALTSLTDWMVFKNRTLDEALADHEGGIWSGDKIVLTDFVPAPLFLKLLRDGQLFEDLVGKAHGIQSHRIQWFVLQFSLGPAEAIALFKEAGQERWMKNGKSMWDQVVDATGNRDAVDFTQPSLLETYIDNKFTSLAWYQRSTKLAKELHEGHEAQPERKSRISERYPSEDEFTAPLKDARDRHRELALERAGLGDQEGAKQQADDLYELMLDIATGVMNETIRNTTDVDGVVQTIEWTGWIPGASSQRPAEARTYFIPTVGKVIG